MAKTIKFNLLLDGNPVRDIKGLQNNFCINDILEVYENGLLQKWLRVRGFDEYLDKVETVKNIKKESSIIVELIKIFDIKKDDQEISESIYSLEFQENRKQSLKNFDTKDRDLKNIIQEYHKNYEKLIETIVEKKENMAFLKEASKEISDKYLKLFELDYKDSFDLYQKKSPFMIYAILMNDKLRSFFMEDVDIYDKLYDDYILNTSANVNKLYIYNFEIFKKYIQADNTIISLDETQVKTLISELEMVKEKTRLIEFKGETNAYWKDLETADTKVMILSIPNGTYIRSANDLKQELSASDVNGNFLILNGLAYKSNNDNESIVYMKV